MSPMNLFVIAYMLAEHEREERERREFSDAMREYVNGPEFQKRVVKAVKEARSQRQI